MRPVLLLSHIQARPLLEARSEGLSEIDISLDLNRSLARVGLAESGVILPDRSLITWDAIAEIVEANSTCFTIEEGDIRKVQLYSDDLNRFYSLYPTRRAPTMLLSGFPMHRIKNIDPIEDTVRKLRAIAPVTGEVLDICTGLGYTAIGAAKTASRVTTIELDPTVLEVCRRNTWSQELFGNPTIQQIIGDAAEVVQTLPDSSFARIFHDPPAFSVAGQLYSGAFYVELHRILKRGGRIFHYIGDLGSTSGRVVSKGVVKRMQEAGFTRVEKRPEAFGLSAIKG